MSTLTNLFGGIAGAIRERGGTADPITAANFPTAIENISTESQVWNKNYFYSTTVEMDTLYDINISDITNLEVIYV